MKDFAKNYGQFKMRAGEEALTSTYQLHRNYQLTTVNN